MNEILLIVSNILMALATVIIAFYSAQSVRSGWASHIELTMQHPTKKFQI